MATRKSIRRRPSQSSLARSMATMERDLIVGFGFDGVEVASAMDHIRELYERRRRVVRSRRDLLTSDNYDALHLFLMDRFGFATSETGPVTGLVQKIIHSSEPPDTPAPCKLAVMPKR